MKLNETFIRCNQCQIEVPRWFAKFAGPAPKPFGGRGAEPTYSHMQAPPALETVMCHVCLGEAPEYPDTEDTAETYKERVFPQVPQAENASSATVERDGANVVIQLRRSDVPFYRWVLPNLTEDDLSAIGKAWFDFFAQRNADKPEPKA